MTEEKERLGWPFERPLEPTTEIVVASEEEGALWRNRFRKVGEDPKIIIAHSQKTRTPTATTESGETFEGEKFVELLYLMHKARRHIESGKNGVGPILAYEMALNAILNGVDSDDSTPGSE